MRDLTKKCLSFMMVFSLIYSPMVSTSANATKNKEEFDRVCSKVLEDVKAKRSKEGDQFAAYCVQADLAKKAKNTEVAKSVIYLTATTVCTTMAILIATAEAESAVTYGAASAQIPAYRQVCSVTSAVAAGGALAADITGKIFMNKTKKAYDDSKDKVCSVSGFMSAVMLPAATIYGPQMAASAATKAGATGIAKGISGAKNAGCIVCAAMSGIMGGISVSQSVKSKQAQEKMVEDAAAIKRESNASVTGLAPGVVSLENTTASAVESTSAGVTASNGSTDTCANLGGNAYLSCMGQFSPEISAISNNPAFLDSMSKSLHGKSLGDFVKGYDGNSDLASYVAGGLGVSASMVGDLAKGSDKYAKDSGIADQYVPSGFVKASSTASLGGPDLDFSKLMAGMAGKIDPDAKEKGDPSELVFRQLELLPADKIEANKDISLFARIAFRYRKNNGNVEKLNWAREQNQSGPTPASVSEKK